MFVCSLTMKGKVTRSHDGYFHIASSASIHTRLLHVDARVYTYCKGDATATQKQMNVDRIDIVSRVAQDCYPCNQLECD